MLDPEVRRKIKERRMALKLSASKAAAKAGISRFYWAAIERGSKNNPSSLVLQSMAEALGVTVAYFYADSVSPQNTIAV